MLFPLITFIIGFKVSRPLVKCVPGDSLVRRIYDSRELENLSRLTTHEHDEAAAAENRILILLSCADYISKSGPLFSPARPVFHYFSFRRREKRRTPPPLPRESPGRMQLQYGQCNWIEFGTDWKSIRCMSTRLYESRTLTLASNLLSMWSRFNFDEVDIPPRYFDNWIFLSAERPYEFVRESHEPKFAGLTIVQITDTKNLFP